MRVKWKVWNVDRAQPVGALFRSFVKAAAMATLLETNGGEHHTVVPA